MAEITSVEIERLGTSYYGGVRGARLRIRSLVLPISYIGNCTLRSADGVESSPGKVVTIPVIEPWVPSEDLFTHFKRYPSEFQPTHALVLADYLCGGDAHDLDRYCLLLLRAVGHSPGVFERIDVYFMKPFAHKRPVECYEAEEFWVEGDWVEEDLLNWTTEGDKLDAAFYRKSLGGGRYEIEIV